MNTSMNTSKTALAILLSLFSLANFGQEVPSPYQAQAGALPGSQMKGAPWLNQSSGASLGVEQVDLDSKQFRGTGGANHPLASKVSVLCFKAPDQNQIAETMEDV